MRNILFLFPYPIGTAGSQRFRYEQYLPKLKSDSLDFQSFIDEATWEVLYKEGHQWAKTKGVFLGFIRRFMLLFRVHKYDVVFVHREATPVGPPIFEWLIAKVWGKKIIYDFDDAIWMTNTSSQNSLASRLKWHRKVSQICGWSNKVSCGNAFLADFAKKYASQVVINPTTIDTKSLHIPLNTSNEPIVIGWTGTHSTLKYLDDFIPILEDLRIQLKFEFMVIADKEPAWSFPELRFVPWAKETEINDLNQIDIGIMPLQDDQWAEGKCGFKALQFMALEKPVIVSPVGVNSSIVEHGVSGFHCSDIDQWKARLLELVTDAELRMKMGKAGRQKVVNEFSVESNTQNFLSLFN